MKHSKKLLVRTLLSFCLLFLITPSFTTINAASEKKTYRKGKQRISKIIRKKKIRRKFSRIGTHTSVNIDKVIVGGGGSKKEKVYIFLNKTMYRKCKKGYIVKGKLKETLVQKYVFAKKLNSNSRLDIWYNKRNCTIKKILVSF